MRTAASTSALALRTVSCAPRATTSGRASSECGAMNVIAIASSPRTRTGPPFERLYAVEPDGVEQIIPSHETTPSSSPAIAQLSSIMRPSVEDAATTSLTAANVSPSRRASSVGCSTTRYSPAKTRARSASSRSGVIDARKPTRPKLTPMTGMSVPRRRASVRRIVPSPPTATVSCASSGSSTTRVPARSATARTCSTAVVTSTRACATIATVSTGECCVDSLVEVIGEGRLLGMDEMQEDLAVSLRAGQSRVYDSGDARLPAERGLGHLAHDAAADFVVAHDAALAHVLASRLELRLDEDDRLPARRAEPQHGRQRDAHGDERDVADRERGREGKLRQRARVRPLHHRDPRVATKTRMELSVPDVERNHASCAALEEHVREPACRRADVDAVEPRRIHAEPVEPVRQLLASAGDVPRRKTDRELGLLVELDARFVVSVNEPGEDQR